MPSIALSSTLLVLLCSPFPSLSSVLNPRSELNGPCDGASGNPGVCVPTAKCTSAGGKYISGACPGTPADVKCCTKPSCGTGGKGICRFTSSCSTGITESNQCPGPDSFKCCMPKGISPGGGSPGGGYPTPSLPTTGSGCKQTAIDGAAAIIKAFPGKVAEVGCKRKCGSDTSSQHCTGMATDMMVAKLGDRSTEGQAIAEWVMNNRKSLSLRYVMWGQRIWQISSDSVKPWEQWDYQSCTVIPNCKNGDRGDNTQNHWDHVHLSYN